MAESKNIGKRYNVISVLRILACLLTLRGHYNGMFNLPDIASKGIITGAGPVVIFFVISGFLAYDGYSKYENTKVYYRKRIFRIIPSYYIVLLMCILADIIVGVADSKLSVVDWLRYFSFTNMIIPSDNFAVSNNLFGFWTMSCFMVFYLLTPLLYKMTQKKNGMIIMLVGSIVLNVLSRLVIYKAFDVFGFDGVGGFANLSPPSTIYLYIFGMAVAYSKHNKCEIKMVFAFGIIFMVMLATEKAGYVLWGIASALICFMPNIEFQPALQNNRLWKIGGGYMQVRR